MKQKINITFTGIDIKTNINLLPKNAEFGILYTDNPQNRNRYMLFEDILNISQKMKQLNFNLALHVCGKSARNKLFNEKIDDLLTNFNRIQINGKFDINEIELIDLLCQKYSDKKIITQFNTTTINTLHIKSSNHQILIDNSGGRGETPEKWEFPNTKKNIGFAGGIGLDNIKNTLKILKSIYNKNFWIDMEGKIRDENDYLNEYEVDNINNIFNELN